MEKEKEIRESDGDLNRVRRVLDKRVNIMETAIIENNTTNAFQSKKFEK